MAQLDLTSTIQLNNGVAMPRFGLGVWQTDNTTAAASVTAAIRHGYRMIDTAKQYGNEAGVGRGLAAAFADGSVRRQDVFVTSKVMNGDHGYERTLAKFEGTMRRLQLDYLDLYLIHWPVDGLYVATWRALEKLYRDGRVRAIGVSNFDVQRLQVLMRSATVQPAVNQVEFNPVMQEHEMRDFAAAHNIVVEGWSPLGGGQALSNPVVGLIAQKHHKSAAQIILRYDVQSGVVTIPKTVHEQRMVENADIFDFALDEQDMQAIAGLDQNRHSLWYDAFGWYGTDTDYGMATQKWPDSAPDYDD
ncbi:aldo/keto reductase [Lacticaseibacillus thailandensis]|uniref:aldo/keto reductase n=1 Tax=Lacticaseibacillus thailandensis TaxID=381741 RepID=UPI000AF58B33|nr:aldo/keto reductase [Lacticaseibacillus thailandensis]